MKNKKLLFILALLLSACNNVTSSSNSVVSSGSVNTSKSTMSSSNDTSSSSVSSSSNIIFSFTISSSNNESTSNESSSVSSSGSTTSSVSSSTTSSDKQSSSSSSNQEMEDPIDKKLGTPTNLVIDNNYYLNWNDVSHASHYLVYVNDLDLVVYDNKVDVFDYLYVGVRNTLTVQAIDEDNKYQASDIARLTYDDGGPFKGITYVEENSFVEGLEIREENGQKVIEVPYDQIAKDESGLIPDVTVTFDYDASKYKFYYETDNNIIFARKVNGQPNTVEVAFRGLGEITLSVVKNGEDSKGYIFDSIVIRVVKSKDKGFSKFSIAYYGFNEEDYSMPLIEADTYEMGSTPMDYVYLTIVVGENDVIEDMSTAVTWSIVSGDALELSFTYDLDAYYIGCNRVGTVLIQAVSCYGDVDTITITVS